MPNNSKIHFKRSVSRVDVDQLAQIEHNDCLLSRILCLHHLRTALSYLCDVNSIFLFDLEDNLTKYNKDYDKFITSTVLRDIAVHHTARQEEFNVLLEALKLERFTIVLIILLSLMAGAASVVIIYYQQTLAKYIITQTPDQQYKWFGIIVGCIVFRFLAFNVIHLGCST